MNIGAHEAPTRGSQGPAAHTDSYRDSYSDSSHPDSSHRYYSLPVRSRLRFESDSFSEVRDDSGKYRPDSEIAVTPRSVGGSIGEGKLGMFNAVIH